LIFKLFDLSDLSLLVFTLGSQLTLDSTTLVLACFKRLVDVCLCPITWICFAKIRWIDDFEFASIWIDSIKFATSILKDPTRFTSNALYGNDPRR